MNTYFKKQASFNMLHEINFVTSNIVKFEEVSSFFVKHAPHINIKQLPTELVEIQTDDQLLITLEKAKQAWNLLEKPILVDDSCVYFENYDKFPGTMTKFVYQNLKLPGIFKLMETGQPMNITVILVLMTGKDEGSIFTGITKGVFDKTRRLDLHRKNAPFDTVFVPNGTQSSVDELRFEGKAEPYQYRMRALQKFLQSMQE